MIKVLPDNKRLPLTPQIFLSFNVDNLNPIYQPILSVPATFHQIDSLFIILQKKAIASTKLVGRLVKLAGELRELWSVATLSEKKEFVSLMVDSISIHPKGKKAEIRLSQNYLETKENLPAKKAGSFLLDGRGDRPLSGRIITPSEVTIKLDRWKPCCA